MPFFITGATKGNEKSCEKASGRETDGQQGRKMRTDTWCCRWALLNIISFEMIALHILFSSTQAPSHRAPCHRHGGKLHCSFCICGLWDLQTQNASRKDTRDSWFDPFYIILPLRQGYSKNTLQCHLSTCRAFQPHTESYFHSVAVIGHYDSLLLLS